jgi:hypothetical protein
MNARRVAISIALVLAALVAMVLVDSSRRRQARASQQANIDAVVRRLPSGDLALSGGARWLRSPTLEEPGAAFADSPALPDPDPAGGIMAPPREAWTLEARRAAESRP